MNVDLSKELAQLPKLMVKELRVRYAEVFGEPTNAANARGASSAYLAVDGASDQDGWLGAKRGGEGLCGVGEIGECVESQDDADHEFEFVGTGDSGGVAVLAQDGEGEGCDYAEGNAEHCEGHDWERQEREWRRFSGKA
jgi:hypothetical protein